MERENLLWKDRKRTLFGLPLSFTKYELTNDRLFISTGILTTKEDEIRLYRILDVQLVRTLGQRIFGVGTILVKSSDKSAGNFELKSVKKSRQVKEILSKQVESERESKRVVNREMMGGIDDTNDGDFDDDDNN